MESGPVAAESSLTGLQSLLTVSSQGLPSGRVQRDILVSLPLIRPQSSWIRAPPLGPHLTLITSLKAPSPNIVTEGIRASTREF